MEVFDQIKMREINFVSLLFSTNIVAILIYTYCILYSVYTLYIYGSIYYTVEPAIHR